MSSEKKSGPITQRDIAKALGISNAAVSLGLSGSPKISEQRVREIQAKATEMGYSPNPVAAALSHYRKTSRVTPFRAVIAWLNFWENPEELRSFKEYDRYWYGALAAAQESGYQLEEFKGRGMTALRLNQILYHRSVSGILLPPHPKDTLPEDWEEFEWDRFSVVRLGRSLETPLCHLVTADQLSNMMVAFKAVRDRGYERIGFLCGTGAEKGRHLFDAGFFKAQSLTDGSFPRLPIFYMENDCDDDLLRRLNQWMETNHPDAILTDSQEALMLLKKAGYRIPEDMGVAAMSIFDGNVDAGIDQNPTEIGRHALISLVSLISTNQRGIPEFRRESLVEGVWADGESIPRKID